MATFNHISGQEPSTVSFKLATVTQTRNSSAMHQEILTIGDPDSSLGLAAVLAAAPASTAWGLVVRPVGVVPTSGDSTVIQGTSPWVTSGASTVAPLAGSAWVVRSSKADFLGTVYQSSAADLQATVAQASTVWAVQLTQYSTTVNVSSLGGAVIIRSSKADALVTAYQSSAADFQATVTQGVSARGVNVGDSSDPVVCGGSPDDGDTGCGFDVEYPTDPV
jgi:hypothetical protein